MIVGNKYFPSLCFSSFVAYYVEALPCKDLIASKTEARNKPEQNPCIQMAGTCPLTQYVGVK